jgi:ribose transport system ATP-binding protein
VLSGGNQQKVALARSLEGRGSVLLLEEPSQGLDVLTRKQIAQYISTAAAERGDSFLISSTDLEFLSDVCTRVHVISGGRSTIDLLEPDLTPRNIRDAIATATTSSHGQGERAS